MKAYSISDRNGAEGYSLVVFAETAGKAKAYAARTDDFCDYGFTGIRVIRKPSLDRFYRGNIEMDWDNDEDRVAMVRYANFECSYEADVSEEDCRACPAFQWCGRRDDWEDADDD